MLECAESTQKWAKKRAVDSSRYSTRLGTARDGFQFQLIHEAYWVILVQSLTLSLTLPHRLVVRIKWKNHMHSTLRSLEGEWNQNAIKLNIFKSYFSKVTGGEDS